MTESTASTILSVAYVTFIAFSIPSGFIATGVGRRRTIIAGLATFAALQVDAFFTPTVAVIVGLLAVGGVAWSLVNVNSLPRVVDTSPLGSVVGDLHRALLRGRLEVPCYERHEATGG